jgi:hypothetical protein
MAVDRDKGAIRPGAVEVYGAGKKLLPRSGLPFDEHGRIGLCDFGRGLEKSGHLRRITQDLIELELPAQVLEELFPGGFELHVAPIALYRQCETLGDLPKQSAVLGVEAGFDVVHSQEYATEGAIVRQKRDGIDRKSGGGALVQVEIADHVDGSLRTAGSLDGLAKHAIFRGREPPFALVLAHGELDLSGFVYEYQQDIFDFEKGQKGVDDSLRQKMEVAFGIDDRGQFVERAKGVPFRFQLREPRFDAVLLPRQLDSELPEHGFNGPHPFFHHAVADLDLSAAVAVLPGFQIDYGFENWDEFFASKSLERGFPVGTTRRA